MNRPRQKGYMDLPPNLYWHKTKQLFYYRHPITEKITYFKMSDSRNTAINTAHYCNQELNKKVSKADVILGSIMTMEKWCEHFENVILPTLGLSKITVNGYKLQIRHIKSHFKDADIAILTVREVSAYIDTKPPVLANRVRSLLIVLFKHAIAKGHCTDNPAAQTMPGKTTKKRTRLSIEQFFMVYNFKKVVEGKVIECPKFLKIAMRLALQTFQRVEDIELIQYAKIIEGTLRVKQLKTGAQIEIDINPELEKVIADSRCDNIVSPYIVHRKPKRNVPFEGRTHYTQCHHEYISKAFSKIRDMISEFQQMPMEERPSFHEIRSLGMKLVEDSGENSQHQAGHKSRKMTEKYLEGHDIWKKVKVSGIKGEF